MVWAKVFCSNRLFQETGLKIGLSGQIMEGFGIKLLGTQ